MPEFIRRPYKVKAKKAGKKKVIHTLEGDMKAKPNDWVVTGRRGEKWPVKPGIFEESYRPAKKRAPKVEIVKLKNLIPNPVNRIIDREKINAIKTAIEESQEIKPLVYTEVTTERGRRNMLTDGHHRYVALKEMGYEEVPAIMADRRGVDTARDEEEREVRKLVESLRNFVFKRVRVAEKLQKHPGHGDQSVHDPTQGGRFVSKPELVREYRSEITRLGELGQVMDTRRKEKELLSSMRHDLQSGSLRRPEYNLLRDRIQRRKVVKHGSHNQQDHDPTRGGAKTPGSAKKPSQTFGRISSKQVDFINRQVPGVKDYYNSLPRNQRPRTATDLITQFQGLQRRPKMKSVKEVKAHLSKGTKVMLSAERSNLSPRENAKRTAQLRSELSAVSDSVVGSDSKYGGSREKGFIASISPAKLKDIKRLADKYDQESHIVIRGGKAEMKFKRGGSMHGDVSETTERVGADDNYSSIGDVKFTIPFKDRKKERQRKMLKNVGRLRDILAKLNRLTKEGVATTAVSGLELAREDLEGGHLKTRRLSQKMDMDEGVDTKHPYKNPDGANIESARHP